jgi:hypothetical protein
MSSNHGSGFSFQPGTKCPPGSSSIRPSFVSEILNVKKINLTIQDVKKKNDFGVSKGEISPGKGKDRVESRTVTECGIDATQRTLKLLTSN